MITKNRVQPGFFYDGNPNRIRSNNNLLGEPLEIIMRKISFTVLMVSLSIARSFGQDAIQNNIEPKRNTIFFEAGGNSFFYSLNYDRLFSIKEKWRLAGRFGLMYVNTFSKQNRSLAGVPLELSYLRGSNTKFFELGIGVSGIYDHYHAQSNPFTGSDSKELVLLSVLRVGYRNQKKEGGLFYKVGFTPLAGAILDLNKDKATRYNYQSLEKFAYPWVSAAVGWTIKD